MRHAEGESRQRCLQEIAQSLEQLKLTLSPQFQDSSGNEWSPQLLNLHSACNCVEQLIRSEQVLLNDGQINQFTTESWNHIRQMVAVLNERVQGIGAFWIPPSVIPYLSLFRQLLGGEKQSPGDIFSDEERRGLSVSLCEVERTWQNANNALEASVYLALGDETPLIQYKRQIDQRQGPLYENIDMPIASLIPTSSGCQVRCLLPPSATLHTTTNTHLDTLPPTAGHGASLNTQGMGDCRISPPVHSQNIDFERFKSPGLPLASQQRNQNDPQHVRGETPRLLELGQSMSFDPLPDSLVARMEDDGLFDSLATLDPPDWYDLNPHAKAILSVLIC